MRVRGVDISYDNDAIAACTTAQLTISRATTAATETIFSVTAVQRADDGRTAATETAG